jgi:hypothetical protein
MLGLKDSETEFYYDSHDQLVVRREKVRDVCVPSVRVSYLPLEQELPPPMDMQAGTEASELEALRW